MTAGISKPVPMKSIFPSLLRTLIFSGLLSLVIFKKNATMNTVTPPMGRLESQLRDAQSRESTYLM